MPYTEDELLPISALQHLLFCERQCALIHIERAWADNRFTVEGHHLHEHVHERGCETRGDIRIQRSLTLRSLELGLSGVADVVEFHRQDDGSWLPLPVEYKRGKPKKDSSDEVQLCAQALCLAEMLDVDVPSGVLFYGKARRRKNVEIDQPLRRQTETAAQRLHEMIEKGRIPAAVLEPKCDRCSLSAICLPALADGHRSAKRFISLAVSRAQRESA